MRKTLFAIAIAALALAGCQKETAAVPGDPAATGDSGFATITLGVSSGDDVQTKASDTSESSQEKAKNNVQFLIFNGDALAAYLPNGTTTATLACSYTYNVYAIVNGPSAASVTSKTALAALECDLATYNDPTADFVMYGTNDISLSSTSKEVTVTVNRLVGRVRLRAINTSGVPSADRFVYVGAFLSNVYKTCTLGGTVTKDATGTMNWYGRKGNGSIGTDKIESSSDVAPSYNWSDSYPVKFYGYPNTAASLPAASTTYAAAATALVVVATWNGTICYYPVPITSGLAANYSYDVSLTITGKGSNDPEVIPANETLSASVSVNPWTAGAEYNPTY